jgi:hypothetical protein
MELITIYSMGSISKFQLQLSSLRSVSKPKYVEVFHRTRSGINAHCLQAFWFPDIFILGVLFAGTLLASYIVLNYFVKEKR